jgi:galacturan 1,4-alpha-galacturonidase
MRFFRADGNSSHLSFSHLNFTVREQWGGSPVAESETFGFEMGDVSDVSINDVTMDFRARTGTAPGGPPGGPVGICAGFEQGSTRISVRNMACVKAWGGALVMVGSSDNSGVYENAMRPNKVPLSTGRGVSDLRVSNLTFDGNWATGFKNALMTSPPEPITNVTWENVNVLSGDAAVGDRCYLRCHCITTWVYTCEASDWIEPFSNIRFEYFVGKLGQKPGPGWGCAQNQTLCDIAFEGWTPTISSREVR